MTNMRRFLCLTSALMLLSAGPAYAQLAPTPKRSPRTPVSKEVLSGKAAPLTPSTVLQGQATILDSERLRIENTEIRLFGVVPPQVGASYGPQARAVLDSLAQNTVTCQIKDRTRDGSYLALCHNAAQADFGLELLRRGLAACARGTLRGTPYDAPYQAAEIAAQNQKLGIWSAHTPTAVSESSIRAVMTDAKNAKAEAEKAKAEAELAKQEVEKAKAELAKLPTQVAQVPAAMEPIEPATVLKLSSGAGIDSAKPPLPHLKPDPALEAEIAAAPTAEDVQAALMAPSATLASGTESRGFLERYQFLLSGLLLFGTTLTLSGAFVWNKTRQKKEDLKSIAAALHGELMAARSVCQARLSKIAQDGNDQSTTWPRIRVMVFQAYLGQLGCLGAELSRQIASIYGMASDYASYYNSVEPRSEHASKKQALEALVQHIEEVVARLSVIEKDGKIPATTKSISFRPALQAPGQKPLSLSVTPKPMPPSDSPRKATGEAVKEKPATDETITSSAELKTKLAEAKTEIVAESAPTAARQTTTSAPKKHPEKKQQTAANAQTRTAATAAKERAQKTAQQVENAAQAALKAVSGLNFKAPIIERLSQLKSLAKGPFDGSDKKKPESFDDFSIPDYANLTEEELEALLYAEEEMIMASPVGKWKQTG